MIDSSRAERLRQKYAQKGAAVSRQEARPKGPVQRGPGGGPGSRFSGGKPQNTTQVIRRLAAYLGRERLLLAGTAVLILVNTVSSLASSYMLRPIINTYIAPSHGFGSLSGLSRALMVMMALSLTSLLSNYAMTRMMLRVSQRVQKNIRGELFAKLQRLPVGFYDRNNNGEIMSRFVNDVDTVGEMLNNTIAQLLSGAITLVGTLCLMLYTNVPLTLLVVVFIPLTVLCIRAFTRRGRKYYGQQQAALGMLGGFIEESMSGQKVIKVFCHEDITMDEFDWLNGNLRAKQTRAQYVGGSMMPLMQGINNLNYVAAACAGVALCILRGFDIGGLTVFVNYARQFGRPINELSGQMNNVYSALAGAERVFEILDTQTEPDDPPDAVELTHCEGALALEHVTFGYDKGHPVLRDISFTAGRGQKIAFVGSTGAGKTTVANLIPRFYDIWDGAITIDGLDIRQITRDSLRRNITVVLQDTHLFGGSVRENIRYGRLDATDEEVEEAARVANAHTFILQLSDGYDTILDKDGTNLSQGQRQLLNIARAALSRAPILILDEATSSIDTRAERYIEQGLDRLAAQRTTLVIAHRLSTVRDADTILVLEQGEIIERGDHETLLRQGGRYFELYTGLAELS